LPILVRQLNLAVGFLRGLLTNHDTQPVFHSPGRTRFAPQIFVLPQHFLVPETKPDWEFAV